MCPQTMGFFRVKDSQIGLFYLDIIFNFRVWGPATY
jgi:hypothetical protein